VIGIGSHEDKVFKLEELTVHFISNKKIVDSSPEI
jgi:hypothetical protein